jgi:hypothetical protein
VEGTDARLGAYAAADGTALRVLLVNRSTDDVEVTWAFEAEAAGYAASLVEVTTLVDAVGYEPHGLLHATQAIVDPLVVPARAAVLVRRDR